MNRRFGLITAMMVLPLIVFMTSCGAVRGERVDVGMSTGSDSAADLNMPAQRDLVDATYVDQVEGNGAFAFTAVELATGQPLSGEELVGAGQMLMTFVVPSCPICVGEGPELARSAAENPDTTYVVVHSGGTAEDYRTYVESSGLALSNVVHIDDSAGVLWLRFGVVQQPSNIFVDGDGGVVQSLGALGETGLQRVLSES